MAIGILMLIYLMLLGLKTYKPDFLPVYPFHDFENDIRAFQLILSLIISFFVILAIEEVHDFFTLFNCLWIIPLSFAVCFFWIKPDDLKKADYLFSKEIKDFKLNKYKEGPWITTEFQMENDNIYFSQRPDWDSIYKGNFKVYKSRFLKSYHLLKKE